MKRLIEEACSKSKKIIIFGIINIEDPINKIFALTPDEREFMINMRNVKYTNEKKERYCGSC